MFHGVSAPLLIHGALAALGLVIGSAIHRPQGRQIFLRSSAIVGVRDWDKLEERLAQLTAQGAEMVTRDAPRFPATLKLIP